MSSSSHTPAPWRERLASPLTWHYAGFCHSAGPGYRPLHPLRPGLGRHQRQLGRRPGRQADSVEGPRTCKPLPCAAWKSASRTLARRCWPSIRSAFRPTIPPSTDRIGELALDGPRAALQGAVHAGQARLRSHRDFHGRGHHRRLSADHAFCEQPGARPDFFCHPRHVADRPAGRPGESAAAGLHLAAAGRCAQRIAAHPAGRRTASETVLRLFRRSGKGG